MTNNHKKPPQVIHGEVIGKGILRVVESHGHPLIQQYVNIHNNTLIILSYLQIVGFLICLTTIYI